MTRNRWLAETDGRGPAYAARFRELEEAGMDVHGEASFVADAVPPGSRVLDAGCGTGRVAIELARRGYDVVGVDLDPSMLSVARDTAPALRWVEADLATAEPPDGPYDAVVLAGNVMIFLAPGTEPDVVRHVVGALRPGGLLVAGFTVEVKRLPLADYDRYAAAAGLELVDRFATWDRDPYAGGDYAVSVHRLPPGS